MYVGKPQFQNNALAVYSETIPHFMLKDFSYCYMD